MKAREEIEKPSELEQKVATESYNALESIIEQNASDKVEIEIHETKDRIVIPIKALKLLSPILKAMSQGKPISMIPTATEVTTDKAAEILGCTRAQLVRLLEGGEIEFTRKEENRKIKIKDILKYKKHLKEI
ncbi:MAG: helix-turn-helix domain-containing protein [Ginsengibacter sp.]|jgi:excisionase family DNA binding protein